MSEALWLFRDFVEKLERAYIAFDGVVGSCLGRAWGGTNHGMEDDDVDVIPRNSESNIAERASFSLPIGLLFRPLIVPESSLVYLYSRIFSISLFSSRLPAFLGRREGNNLTIDRSSVRNFSLYFSLFFFTACFPICTSLSRYLASSQAPVLG